MSPRRGCWEMVWLKLIIRNWDTKRKREIEKYKRKREKCLRKQEDTEITGMGKRWIPVARKYPSQGEQKGGRSKGQCKRVSWRVLPSKMGWVERRHPSMLAYPGKPVKRPRVIVNCEAFKWCASGRDLNLPPAHKWLIYYMRCRLFCNADMLLGGKG